MHVVTTVSAFSWLLYQLTSLLRHDALVCIAFRGAEGRWRLVLFVVFRRADIYRSSMCNSGRSEWFSLGYVQDARLLLLCRIGLSPVLDVRQRHELLHLDHSAITNGISETNERRNERSGDLTLHPVVDWSESWAAVALLWEGAAIASLSHKVFAFW